MADFCDYKIKVRGKKNACYAFMSSTSAVDDREIINEFGSDDDYTLLFKGCCKWSIDSYCKKFHGEKPVILPGNLDDVIDEAENKYWYHTVQERSEMFGVEVWCNSGSVETFESCIAELLESGEVTLEEIKENEEFSPYEYQHYNCGKEIWDDMPEEIAMNFTFLNFDSEDEYYEED